MMRGMIIAAAVLSLGASHPHASHRRHPTPSAGMCGTERWDQKILAAYNPSSELFPDPPVTKTIAEINAMPSGCVQSGSPERTDIERQRILVSGTVKLVKHEKDQDLNIVLADETGATMVVESPSAACVGSSRYRDQLVAARKDAEKLHAGDSVTVEGPIFYDYFHGQTGMSKSCVEVHPILRIVGSGTWKPASPPGASQPSPSPTADTYFARGAAKSAAPFSWSNSSIDPITGFYHSYSTASLTYTAGGKRIFVICEREENCGDPGVLMIYPSGRSTFPKNYNLDEAARAFWEAIIMVRRAMNQPITLPCGVEAVSTRLAATIFFVVALSGSPTIQDAILAYDLREARRQIEIYCQTLGCPVPVAVIVGSPMKSNADDRLLAFTTIDTMPVSVQINSGVVTESGHLRVCTIHTTRANISDSTVIAHETCHCANDWTQIDEVGWRPDVTQEERRDREKSARSCAERLLAGERVWRLK